ncbi:MAG: 1-deoxy-D-xylulose-5-phosphate synthase [Firmicutes bacterium]|uniref:1-deoxy-D-xylulose-5-phosphate synthase n=1 Tax=Melghirimyces thermohalophilus TaxID=1236220 RepID=A0A1G6Q9E0_9BACL|nr:1-deoxy-D-xylulose-5-phosphate synthase [Melghirimyces thermohalophilus]MDA8354462.1 1-deoxy-D-xylulose-5-phosphate synthase [Bacillota bacterium]SDC89090.1 1-deoxy-D-xylulose-5-phosphate synthase [Melghirimyces thermohalophilus]
MHLEQINSPEQLKRVPVSQLPRLAEEIRQFLIDSLSITGGHLGSNLGVVELTLALHYLFDSPKDRFIWDVGHQAYVHKILTGRLKQFDTLRQYKGMCGFPKMRESEHDVWETGHSSTSLSAAMGMAVARDIKGESHRIVPIIGDGALTGGMALEALNHIGNEQRNILCILNDNEMSISPNVGAIHNYLGKLRTHKHYHKIKEEMEYFLKKIPTVGGAFASAAERVKDSMKYLVVSGVLFEKLGLTYLGPVNGHSMDELLECLRQADQTEGPVLVHVVTQKGKGYLPAETHKEKLHGVTKGYKLESNKGVKKSNTPVKYPKVFGDTLIRLAEQDQRVIGVTPAMLGGSGMNEFAARFPDRCFDVGIAEQHATTFAAGVATQGMKPVLAIYSTFLQRGYDQLIHDIARQKLDVVLAVDRAGFVGADGETHQGVYDIAYMRCIPNMVVMMPKDENEFQHMLYTAYRYEGPIAVRFPRGTGLGVEMDEELKELPIGKSEVLREGGDVALLAFGTMVPFALEAADRLAREGIRCKVVNARFAKPLDSELLDELAREQLPIITIEEASAIGGFGSGVLEYFSEQEIYDMQVKTIGVPDYFVEHGDVKDQRGEVGLTVERIAHTAHNMVPRRRQRA